jgi:uncharacterized protein YgiM (DUF1202 family)
MSDRYGSYPPDDEPIIGATYTPPSPPPPSQEPEYIGADPYAQDADGDEWDEGNDSEYPEEDGYYDDEYYDGAPARQPMFYVFLGLAAVVGGIIIFLLFSMVRGNDDTTPGSPGPVKFNVLIDSPGKAERIEIGRQQNVTARATSTEPLVKFELLVGGKVVDSVPITETPADNTYTATMKTSFSARGEYELFVRVTSSSNATRDSDKIKVVAIEPVGDKPQVIQGKVVADVNLRIGPGDEYQQVGTLKAGQAITIAGRNKTNDWLLVQVDATTQRWIKRSAVDLQDAIELVPIRDVTPTPAPQSTSTPVPSPSPSPSASVSPSPPANAPDFVPLSAVLMSGGAKLRVTVSNNSGNAYNGALVVGVGGGDVPASEVVVDAKMPGGGSATFDFDVTPPITTSGKKVNVTVDPKNAVKESREDNNSVTFSLLPPVEEPNLSVSATIAGTGLNVTVSNSGGAIAAPAATIEVKLNDQTTTQGTSLNINKGEKAVITGVPRPTGGGTATISVIVNGTVLATGQVLLPAQ